MPFKAEWEKTSTEVYLTQSVIERMIECAFTAKKPLSYELIAGGCANLNFKILLENRRSSFILRVYLRDKGAAHREQNLGTLLKDTVATPISYFTGKVDGYQFAITEFMHGITLRNLLLSDSPHNISMIMREVGTILSNITSYKFSCAGFLDHELKVIPQTPSDYSYVDFVQESLKQEKIIPLLSPQTISKVKLCFDQYSHLLPEENTPHLVHGDFDPANILVDQIDSVWRVSGVLDWEFAFSGSVLWDVANMLRYAHKMPPEFQASFLKGLKDSGVKLPKNWQITVHLLNLSSLIDCLKRSDPEVHPVRCADIYELINFILSELNNM